MKREELEKMLGAKVTITLFDNEKITGYLHKSGEALFKDDLYLYLTKNRYFLTNENAQTTSCIFRTSHVKKCIKIT